MGVAAACHVALAVWDFHCVGGKRRAAKALPGKLRAGYRGADGSAKGGAVLASEAGEGVGSLRGQNSVERIYIAAEVRELAQSGSIWQQEQQGQEEQAQADNSWIFTHDEQVLMLPRY